MFKWRRWSRWLFNFSIWTSTIKFRNKNNIIWIWSNNISNCSWRRRRRIRISRFTFNIFNNYSSWRWSIYFKRSWRSRRFRKWRIKLFTRCSRSGKYTFNNTATRKPRRNCNSRCKSCT
jgi:hypothetical protein